MKSEIFNLIGIVAVFFLFFHLKLLGSEKWEIGFYGMTFLAVMNQLQILCLYKLVESYKR